MPCVVSLNVGVKNGPFYRAEGIRHAKRVADSKKQDGFESPERMNRNQLLINKPDCKVSIET